MHPWLAAVLVATAPPPPALAPSPGPEAAEGVLAEGPGLEPSLASSTAPAEPAPEPAPEPEQAATAAPGPPEEPPPGKPNWIDVGHSFVEQRLFAPVLRLDRFFSDERDLEPARARSFIRWRNEVRFEQDASEPHLITGVSANLVLPGLNKQLRRLRFEILGQTRDAIQALFPGDQGAQGPTGAPGTGTADAGLALHLWDSLATHADLGAGVMMRLPPGAYGRVRFRFAEPLGARFLSRQALTGFWRTDTHFGATGSAELERPLTRMMIARLLGSGSLTEVSRGVEWLGDAAVVATFDARSGAQFGFSLTGATRATPGVDRYWIYTRLRRDFYRRWIFLELEPQYLWPWSPEAGRHAEWSVALRLEVQFHGNEAPRVPDPGDEPPDPK